MPDPEANANRSRADETSCTGKTAVSRPTVIATPQTITPEADKSAEVGGPTGPDPVRYGDWERKGRCIDF
jgi:hypothetical protein